MCFRMRGEGLPVTLPIPIPNLLGSRTSGGRSGWFLRRLANDETPMNIEKTIEFILDMQAKSEERFAKADARADRADRRMDRLERITKQLVRSGLSLRSDVRELQKFRLRAEKFQARTEENLAEITDKLDALIDVVDKSIRRNGGAR